MNDDLLVRLRSLKEQCGPNLHDGVIITIKACILEGVDEGPQIVETLTNVGFNRRHVGLTLASNAGAFAERHHWYRSNNGRYRLHGP